MISAFGVEHGDVVSKASCSYCKPGQKCKEHMVSKADFNVDSIIKPLKAGFGATKKFAGGLKSGYNFKPAKPGASLVPTSKPKSAFGRGNAIGTAIGANKGLTAGAAAGGAAVAGGAGYAMGNRKRF